VLALGVAEALGLGVVLAEAIPPKSAVHAAVRTTSAAKRPVPGGRLEFNVGPPWRHRCPRPATAWCLARWWPARLAARVARAPGPAADNDVRKFHD
jgi:hypothetical protein